LRLVTITFPDPQYESRWNEVRTVSDFDTFLEDLEQELAPLVQRRFGRNVQVRVRRGLEKTVTFNWPEKSEDWARHLIDQLLERSVTRLNTSAYFHWGGP
jgi:hypothetical protein